MAALVFVVISTLLFDRCLFRYSHSIVLGGLDEMS